MSTTLPLESGNWVLPSQARRLSSTTPNYDEFVPQRVNRAGVQNYLRNRGSLNLGDWAIEGQRKTTGLLSNSAVVEPNAFEAPAPKVLGPDAMRNYLKSRTSTPNLIHGNLDPPNPHHHFRVKREGSANYKRNQHSQMKLLFDNYGKLPLPSPKAPHTQGEMATNLYYKHREGTLGSILHNYGHNEPPPQPNPHIQGAAAEFNLHRGQGHAHLLEYTNESRPTTAEPHVIGTQAHINYETGQGRAVNKLFHEYGKLPQSARLPPKVKYGGVQNYENSQGTAMMKAITQCPPSNRYIEQLQSVEL